MRSNKNSDDYATTVDVLKEIISEYQIQGKTFDNICCIYATAPFANSMITRNIQNYIKDNVLDDWFYTTSPIKKGTKITLWISKHCVRILKNIFLAYMNPEDHRFEKTEILVELAKQGGERYISRSQAKRILVGLEKFSRIMLDCRGVETVGQGFVDEIFRVFQNQYPSIQINYCNANEAVTFMIKRGLVNHP